MKNKLAITSLALASLTFSSCIDIMNELTKKILEKSISEATNFDYEDSESLGEIVTRELALSPFSEIDASGAVQVVIRQDSVCGVSVTGNEKCLDMYSVEVVDNELEVKLRSFSGKVSKHTPHITVNVKTPSISEVEVSGAGNIEFAGNFVNDMPLSLELSGAGNISVDSLIVPSFTADVSGAGSFCANKITSRGDVKIELSGAGNIKADVHCKKVKAEISGVGDLTLTGSCVKKIINASSRVVAVDTSGLVAVVAE